MHPKTDVKCIWIPFPLSEDYKKARGLLNRKENYNSNYKNNNAFIIYSLGEMTYKILKENGEYAEE